MKTKPAPDSHNSLVNTHKDWYFQHIPKTGGSSIIKYFDLPPTGHMMIREDLLPKEEYKIYCVLRDPIDRFMSAHFMFKEWENGRFKDTTDTDILFQKQIIGKNPHETLKNLCQHVTIAGFFSPQLIHFLPQSRWLRLIFWTGNDYGVKDNFKIAHHLNFKNLQSEFLDFVGKNNKEMKDFPHEKKTNTPAADRDKWVTKGFVHTLINLYQLDYIYAAKNCSEIYRTWKFSDQLVIE